MPQNPASILRRYSLKDTQSRRFVLKALLHFSKPVLHKDIHAWIQKHDAVTSLVTVYRTLEKFQELGIVHRHPSSGGFILCSVDEAEGHHCFLSCEECGSVAEFSKKTFCSSEEKIAQEAGFTPKKRTSEIIGVCSRCH